MGYLFSPRIHSIVNEWIFPAGTTENKNEIPEKFGEIFVSSDPSQAAVYLNGKENCRSPCSIERLEIGKSYQIKVTKKGFFPWTLRFDLGEEHNKRRFDVTLRKKH